jgi:hypothetical protein
MKIRNPKSEIRNPKEARNPKSEGGNETQMDTDAHGWERGRILPQRRRDAETEAGNLQEHKGRTRFCVLCVLSWQSLAEHRMRGPESEGKLNREIREPRENLAGNDFRLGVRISRILRISRLMPCRIPQSTIGNSQFERRECLKGGLREAPAFAGFGAASRVGFVD